MAYLKHVTEVPDAGARCRHLEICGIDGPALSRGDGLVVLMAIIARLTNMTALVINVDVTAHEFGALMRIARRNCRLSSVSLLEDMLDGEVAEAAAVKLDHRDRLWLQYMSMARFSVGMLRLLGAGACSLRSLSVASNGRLDVAAFELVVTPKLRELIIRHIGPRLSDDVSKAVTSLVQRCASQLRLLVLRGLGGGLMHEALRALSTVVVLDLDFDSVGPEVWLFTLLPRLRVLQISPSLTDIGAGDFDAAVIVAGAMHRFVWPSLALLYYPPWPAYNNAAIFRSLEVRGQPCAD